VDGAVVGAVEGTATGATDGAVLGATTATGAADGATLGMVLFASRTLILFNFLFGILASSVKLCMPLSISC
jgi:hypothetical protein